MGVVLVLVERSGEGLDELSGQALTLGRAQALEASQELHAVLMVEADDPAPADGALLADDLGAHGVSVAHVAGGEGLEAYAPAAWAAAVSGLSERLGASMVLAAGSDRGNEVLAHVGARLDQPVAANCTAVSAGDPLAVTRVRWGGSLLEQALLHGSPALLTVAPHAIAARTEAAPPARLEPFSPAIDEADRRAQVREHIPAAGGGRSLADAKVVVSGGRGVGSAEGFAVIEELAQPLAAAVGCSRAVTMAGWRPHTDQVGQTGTKIAPEIYIACGISGATQHMAGCRGAKKLLAINSDAEASILASADYAVIGDLHEVLPAISAEIRRARGQ
jgi:electron transfer flavoprotein alpha subunit